MTRRTFLRLSSASLSQAAFVGQVTDLPSRTGQVGDLPHMLDPETFRHHVETFNAMGPEEVVNIIPDAQAWEWVKRNVPLFTCPDRDIEPLWCPLILLSPNNRLAPSQERFSKPSR